MPFSVLTDSAPSSPSSSAAMPPKAQYGFITEADENPFDDEPVVPAPRQQPRPQQGQGQRASGNQQQPRGGQPQPPQYSQPPQQPKQQPAYSQQQQRAPEVQQPRAQQAVPQQQQPTKQPAYSNNPPPQTPSPPPAAASAPAKKSAFSGMLSSFGIGASEETAPEEDTLESREAKLAAREAKMKEMEDEVQERERQVRAKESGNKNWPSKCIPLYYHSIKDEIPATLKPMIRKFYALLFLTWICLIFNFVAVLVVYFVSGNGGTDPIWAAVWCLGVPGSWVCWYRPVYQGAKGGASRKYLVFFCTFIIHLIYMIILAIGTPSMGAAGLLSMIKEYGGGYPVSGTFVLVSTGLLSINTLASLYLLKKARDAWRSGGGSDELAKDRAKLKLASKVGLGAV